MISSEREGSSDLEKNRRPSAERCVSAESMEEMWWRIGVEDSDLVMGNLFTVGFDEACSA